MYTNTQHNNENRFSVGSKNCAFCYLKYIFNSLTLGKKENSELFFISSKSTSYFIKYDNVLMCMQALIYVCYKMKTRMLVLGLKNFCTHFYFPYLCAWAELLKHFRK